MNNNLEKIEKFESIEIIIHIFYLHIYLRRSAGAEGAWVAIAPLIFPEIYSALQKNSFFGPFPM